MSGPDERSGASWLRYSHLGLQFTLTMLLGLALGWWLDGRLGTEPWLLIVGMFAATALATYALIREVARIGRD